MKNLENNCGVSVGEWLITYLIMIIPIVNVIMLFVWAFGDGTKESKANWAKASLILAAIGLVIGFFFFSLMVSMFASLTN